MGIGWPVLVSDVNLETRVPRNHPLRTITALVDKVLHSNSGADSAPDPPG